MSKIGLIDIDSKIPNLALMKISTAFKNDGCQVGLAYPMNYREFDQLFASSIFDYSDKTWVHKEAICGGTGYDLKNWLPDDIDLLDPDYSLYPNYNFSIQRFSRGCVRECPYCVVWRAFPGKTETLKPMKLNPNGKWIYVMDDNFFSNPYWEDAIKEIISYDQPIKFDGIDVRFLNEEKCKYLSQIKLKTQIHMAWDNPKIDLYNKFKEILQWISAYKIMVYVLIGYWSTPEEDLYRVEKLRELKIDPFVMPYNKEDQYQKDFARWVNHKAIFKSVKWEDYK